MLHPEKFVKLGIDWPKGILCYGPPETGKTVLARAVANQTNASFIRVIGSEVVQNCVGEGAHMVCELFQVMWCCSQTGPQEAEQTQKAWFCAVHSDFKLMLATCPVAECLAPQEIPVSIYCLRSQWILYSCAVLSLQSIYNLSLGPDILI
jgi:nicotinamide riboside kinase